ncbi:TPA: hypothetical protein QDC03_003291 [Burkholderia cepacia]|uniref:DUF1016 N-terminal domain-containing protein n=1 Tax=Burkholderia cepacia complex TaxID=87882 RepID=UPI00158DEB1B|nr:DUF1016 N-terminal domain-containing protein [Burkholderia cepacia]HDR9508192.1 hypothetical protein [Burkholderia cepacia]
MNALTTATYWEIGRRIVAFEQGGEGRAAYGKAVIRHLGADLPECLGRGFGWWNLAQMRAFYLTWPVDRIVQTLPAKSTTAQIVPTPSAKSAKPSKATANRTLEPSTVARAFPLTWSAYVRLLSVKTSAARDFYETEALREGWSVRQLGRSTRPPDEAEISHCLHAAVLRTPSGLTNMWDFARYSTHYLIRNVKCDSPVEFLA